MKTSSETDVALTAWAERVFNSGAVKRTPSRRGMTGLRLAGPNNQSRGLATSARTVRSKLAAIVKRTPQVLVRVSGGGRNIRHVKAHLDYISRNGQITLEDQNGEKINGRDEVAALRDEWQFGGFPIVDSSNARQAFNIVLSMPAGTDERAVLDAAREFAASEFSNHQYAMALHTFDTDPDKDPSPNPHVHLCVKAMGLDGVRLNPRKDDLQRWREGFAHHLRERGVEAEATRRIHRLKRERGEKQSVRYQKARGDVMHSIGRSAANPKRVANAKRLESDMVTGYREMAKVLAASASPSDRSLALGIACRVAQPDFFEGAGRQQEIGQQSRRDKREQSKDRP